MEKFQEYKSMDLFWEERIFQIGGTEWKKKKRNL